MKRKIPFVGVADGYSSGGRLPGVLRPRGLRCFHVKSSPDVKFGGGSFRGEDYDIDLGFSEPFDRLVQVVKELEPVLVVAGTQTGIKLTDKLGDALGLPGNDPGTSDDRIDKHCTHARLVASGVPTIRELVTDDPDQAIEWMRREGISKVVCGPRASAGTDQTFACGEGEVHGVFAAIKGHTDRMGNFNAFVLVREFAYGIEYIVNTVSEAGRHIVTDMWHSAKTAANGRQFIYERTELLESTGPLQDQLREYNRRTLDAVGMRDGPSTQEIIVRCHHGARHGAGPVNIDLSAGRMSGGELPLLSRECTGMGQLGAMGLLADCVLHRSHLDDEPYTLKKRAYVVPLISRVQGVVESLRYQEEVRALPSLYDFQLRVRPGDRINLTEDVFTTPGLLLLVHSDRDVLERDYQRFRELERNGLFQVRKD